MKNLIQACCIGMSSLWLLSTPVQAQPTVTFANYGAGWAGPWYTPSDPPALFPTESTCLAEPTGGTNLISGTGYTAELWAGLEGSAYWQLQPVSQTTFRTGTLAGLSVTPAVTVVPFASAGNRIAYQLRVWNNAGGSVNSWAQALASVACGATDVYISPVLSAGATTLEFRDGYQLSLDGFAFRCPVISVSVAGTGKYLTRGVYEGDNVTFTVECPNPAATVQWSRHGTNLPGETNLTLHVTGIDSASAGLYTAVVTAAIGPRIATMTNTATVSLLPPPRLVQPRLHPLNGFIAQIEGVPNRNVQIDVSPDLQAWTPWHTQYIGMTAFPRCFFQDSITNALPQPPSVRFYRARVLP